MCTHDKDGQTPLIVAATNGDLCKVNLLIRAKVDVNGLTSKGRYPIHCAAVQGHMDVVHSLIAAKADVNVSGTFGASLDGATVSGQVEIVRLLIESKADVDKARNNGYTPAIVAASNDEAECLQMLICAKADVDKANAKGFTPVIVAVDMAHSECLQLLIRAKADVDIAANNGATPALVAIQKNQAECLHILCGFQTKLYMKYMKNSSFDNGQESGKPKDVVTIETTNYKQEKLDIAKLHAQHFIEDTHQRKRRRLARHNSDNIYEMPLRRIAKIIKMWHKYGAWSNITFDALALSLFGSQMGVDAEAMKTEISRKTTQCYHVQVEWACTGNVLSYGFQLSRSEPIVCVGMLLGMLLPPNPLYVAYLHRVFHGHGGRELTNVDGERKCGDVLKSGDVLVILPGICQVDVDKANNEGFTPTYVAAKKSSCRVSTETNCCQSG